jgi:hypothetical protein
MIVSRFYRSVDLDEVVRIVICEMDDQHKEMLLRLLGVTKDNFVYVVPTPAIDFVQGALDHIDRVLTPDFCEQQFQEEYDRNE